MLLVTGVDGLPFFFFLPRFPFSDIFFLLLSHCLRANGLSHTCMHIQKHRGTHALVRTHLQASTPTRLKRGWERAGGCGNVEREGETERWGRGSIVTRNTIASLLETRAFVSTLHPYLFHIPLATGFLLVTIISHLTARTTHGKRRASWGA